MGLFDFANSNPSLDEALWVQYTYYCVAHPKFFPRFNLTDKTYPYSGQDYYHWYKYMLKTYNDNVSIKDLVSVKVLEHHTRYGESDCINRIMKYICNPPDFDDQKNLWYQFDEFYESRAWIALYYNDFKIVKSNKYIINNVAKAVKNNNGNPYFIFDEELHKLVSDMNDILIKEQEEFYQKFPELRE